MKDFIQNLRAKPEHVRKRIAFGTSAGVTSLVGLIWVTTLVSTNAFALAPAGDTTPQDAPPIALTSTNVKSNFSQLMGAVGAVAASSTQPALTIIDGHTSSSFDAATTTNPSATVIPF